MKEISRGIDDIEGTLGALQASFAARASFYDETAEIATENLADLNRAGVLGLALPRAFGGREIGLRQISHVIGRVAEGDPSTALILLMQFFMTGMIGRSSIWPADLRQEVLGCVAQEGALINALRVEPELGTPVRGGLPVTTIRRDGASWRLDGRKIFSTGSTALRWGLVWARTRGDAPRVGHVLVPLDLPGVRIEKSWRHLGMRATGSHTVIFENVALPERYLFELLGTPTPAPTGAEAAAASWLGIALGALYNGVAISARNWLVSFLQARVPSNLGKPLASLPRFHDLLGQIDALLLANRSLIDYGMAQSEVEKAGGSAGNLIKHLITENAISVVEKAVAATGNPGLSQDNPLERHYRDVLCGRVHSPQADMILEQAGRQALGQ